MQVEPKEGDMSRDTSKESMVSL
nr:hypothetical protein [Tanacetum cinerariifolium]